MSKPNSSKRPHTMGRQLVLLFLAFTFVPLLMSNAWGYLQSRKGLVDAALRDLSSMAEIAALKTNDFVRDQRDMLTDLERQLLSSDASLRPDGEPGLAEFGRVVDESQSLVGLVLQERGVSTAVPSTLPAPIVDACGDESSLHGLFLHDHGEEPLLVLGRQVAVGVRLCAAVRFDVHRELMSAHQTHDLGVTIYLLDEDGRVVCGSEHIEDVPIGEPFGVPTGAGRQNGSPDSHDHGSDHSGSPATGGHTPNQAGVAVLTGYAPVPGQGWSAVVEVPESRALSRLEGLKRQAALLSMVLALVLIPAIVLVSRTTTERLRSLARTAKELAGGALGQEVAGGGPRELEDLASAFNQMSHALKASHDNLESRISSRTADLEASRAFLELILDSIDFFVLVVDESGNVLRANRRAREIWGADLVGQPYSNTCGGELPAGALEPLARAISDRQISRGQQTRTINGRTEILRIDTFPLPESVRGRGVVQVGNIVTEERHMQAQMIHQEKMAAVGLIAAGVAHEIGNPLASIQAQIDVTRQVEAELSDTGRETLDVVAKQVTRIGRLLRDLVDFSRRDRDEHRLISLKEVIEDVTRLLEHDRRARAVTIEAKIDGSVPLIWAREDPLLQVMLNLGLNAIDAMQGQGTLTFEAAAHQGWGEVRVCDTGRGVTDEARSRLFEPFFTTKAPGRGTGLGLFVSRTIVSDLGGQLELERTGPDGTVFALRIPLASDDQPEAP